MKGWRGPLTSILLLIVTAFSLPTSLQGVLGFLLGPLKTWSHLFYCLILLMA